MILGGKFLQVSGSFSAQLILILGHGSAYSFLLLRSEQYHRVVMVQESRPVVFKREPLGSLREECLIPRRKFVPGGNWGGKAVNEKIKILLLVYSAHKNNCTARLALMELSTKRKHKLLHHHRLSQFFQSTAWPP